MPFISSTTAPSWLTTLPPVSAPSKLSYQYLIIFAVSLYHLRPNSTISIVTDDVDIPTPARNSEQAQIAAIAAELAAVRTDLVPKHTQFLSDLPTKPRASLAKEHLRLAELLLQALLRVDNLTPEHDWDAARAERKAAVKEIQGLLDKIDDAWSA